MKILTAFFILVFSALISDSQIRPCDCTRIDSDYIVADEKSEIRLVDIYGRLVSGLRVDWTVSGLEIINGNGSSNITVKPTRKIDSLYKISASVIEANGCHSELNKSGLVISRDGIEDVDYWPFTTTARKIRFWTDAWKMILDKSKNKQTQAVMELTFNSGESKKHKISFIKGVLKQLRLRKVNLRRHLFYFHPDARERTDIWLLQPSDRPECRDFDMTKAIRADQIEKKLPTLFQSK